MWSVISVSLALIINFYSPEIPESKKSIVIHENDSQRSFPYKYFYMLILYLNSISANL